MILSFRLQCFSILIPLHQVNWLCRRRASPFRAMWVRDNHDVDTNLNLVDPGKSLMCKSDKEKPQREHLGVQHHQFMPSPCLHLYCKAFRSVWSSQLCESWSIVYTRVSHQLSKLSLSVKTRPTWTIALGGVNEMCWLIKKSLTLWGRYY